MGSTLLTKSFEEDWAKRICDGARNRAEREAMELYNNEVGCCIATANKARPTSSLRRWSRPPSRRASLVIDKNAKLASGDAVALWDHGTTSADAINGAIAVPTGDASANAS